MIALVFPSTDVAGSDILGLVTIGLRSEIRQ
jgi:hypothetical protein